MSDFPSSRFTTGQFAALHQIHKKTLLWYDEIGLFRPAYVGDNGYRYYTYAQSSTLEAILLLRELGVSTGEIRQFLDHRSADSLSALLAEQIGAADRSIARLKAIRARLCGYQAEMQALAALDVDRIEVVTCPRQYLALVPTSPTASPAHEIEQVTETARSYGLEHLHEADYGSMLPVSSLYAGRMDDYEALFIRLPASKRRRGLHVRPAGRYVRAYYQGSWDGLAGRYRQILSYAQENGLRLTGHAYETGINELVISQMREYITCIEIALAE